VKNLSIRTKLIALVIVGLITLGVVLTTISATSLSNSLLKAEFNKLLAVQTSKKIEIENYFAQLKSLLTSLAKNEATKEAFIAFEKGFYSLEKDISLDIEEVKTKLKSDFENNYLAQVNYDVPNSASKKSTQQYLPTNNNALIAQYIFIADNQNKLGEKNKLVYNEKYDSHYMRAHNKYHQSFDAVLNGFALYDIFMVDLDGNLIYTDFKEKDYATNLKDGVYSDTGIARAYKGALGLNEGEIKFDDFAPYEPSYNSAASFIATPIFIDGVKKGVLIFQMPVDSINSIMQFDGKHDVAGLGESGECYLVGQDYKMRSNSRFVKDIKDPVIQALNSTIGILEIKTNSTKAVFTKNQAGRWIIDDYRGVSVLSAYAPLDIFSQEKWAIVVEIDEDEALAAANNLLLNIVLIAAICIIIVIFIMVFAINKAMIAPLERFKEGLLGFFQYLNRQRDSIEELPIEHRDEIGIMAEVINKNIAYTRKSIEEDKQTIASTVKVLQEFEQGDLCQRVQTNSMNPALQELTQLLNQMGEHMEENIDKVLDTLEKYTQYDYTNKLDEKNIKAHLLKLAQGVNSLGDSITGMLIKNQENGNILDDNSKILLDNVNTLNLNANESATALEQTAAALEEITSNVSHTTDNIIEMSNLAANVTTSANEGEKLANETTNAMDHINKEVSSINEAITVIDQIAFQTNILSLNAAVEAATAGEAGKGFAVVAGEVRNLASRSAEAAKEIKKLVESATSKANNGKQIADKMIDGYNVLNQNIEKTLELISDVESASKEQRGALHQINDTINSLDSKTQNNANIASKTNEIAKQTDAIAQGILDEVNEKEFIGKKSVKVKKVIKETLPTPKQPTPVVKAEVKKVEPVKVQAAPKLNTIQATPNEDDEWESF